MQFECDIQSLSLWHQPQQQQRLPGMAVTACMQHCCIQNTASGSNTAFCRLLHKNKQVAAQEQECRVTAKAQLTWSLEELQRVCVVLACYAAHCFSCHSNCYVLLPCLILRPVAIPTAAAAHQLMPCIGGWWLAIAGKLGRLLLFKVKLESSCMTETDRG